MNDPHDEHPPGRGNGRPTDADAEAEAERSDTAAETGLELAEQPTPTPAEIEALRRENADLRDQLLRRRADFENYRKRVERERVSAGLEALVTLLKDLVASLDNLERALESPGDGASVREGVVLIQRALLSTLESHGLRVDDPTGLPFDPEIHQALSYDDAPGHSEGTIVRVLGKGYFLKDRLLRPAMVQVARGAPPERAEEPGASTGRSDAGDAPDADTNDASRTNELH